MTMRRRRRHEEEHENHERWLVSYADFITLLFAFFVVMYAISSINEGKYRVLSDSITSAFRNTPGNTDGTIQPLGVTQSAPQLNVRPQVSTKQSEQKRKTKEKMRHMAKELVDALGPLVQNGQVKVTEGALGITLEINASLLFAPGDARLDPAATRVLGDVADIMASTDFPIIVEGHTDNVPISNSVFASNWELSVVRASSVVRLFVDKGVDARRLTASGYADQRPIADNATPEGRLKNRRVAITIESRTPDDVVDVPLERRAD